MIIYHRTKCIHIQSWTKLGVHDTLSWKSASLHDTVPWKTHGAAGEYITSERLLYQPNALCSIRRAYWGMKYELGRHWNATGSGSFKSSILKIDNTLCKGKYALWLAEVFLLSWNNCPKVGECSNAGDILLGVKIQITCLYQILRKAILWNQRNLSNMTVSSPCIDWFLNPAWLRSHIRYTSPCSNDP